MMQLPSKRKVQNLFWLVFVMVIFTESPKDLGFISFSYHWGIEGVPSTPAHIGKSQAPLLIFACHSVESLHSFNNVIRFLEKLYSFTHSSSHHLIITSTSPHYLRIHPWQPKNKLKERWTNQSFPTWVHTLPAALEVEPDSCWSHKDPVDGWEIWPTTTWGVYKTL